MPSKKKKKQQAPKLLPCPKCKRANPDPVTFTWWGGSLGPKLISHVECLGCGYRYNARTGTNNRLAIAIYFGVIIVLIVFLSVWFQTHRFF